MPHTPRRSLLALVTLALSACTSGGEVVEVIDTIDASVTPRDVGRTPPRDTGGLDAGRSDSGGIPTFDVQPRDVPPRDVQPNYDAFFADNPLPRYCGPDGSSVDAGPTPELPGGSPECPDDLTREGCPCTEQGAMRECWPGLRANRNRGICRDGMTRCEPYDELSGRWGPCQGYVLPDPAVRLGPGSCQCFSRGRWELTNTSPCFVTYGRGAPTDPVYAVSTYLNAMGRAQCPTQVMGSSPPPRPMSGTTFSDDFLTVDCTGQFELCYAMRAGDATRPMPTDCVVARVCTSAWYPTAGERQRLPPLPAWSGTDPACARRFADSGGYGEMTVVGQSSECQRIDDGGQPYVFNRVTYCPLRCATTPTLPECAACGTGGSGMF